MHVPWRRMGDALKYGIELGVGIASVAMAWPSWRRGGWFRVVGAVLAVAGVAAIAHAVSRLVS
jgi:hypothetical protein